MTPISRFNQVIRKIETLYSDLELGFVIRWADNTYQDRWSRAINRLDLSLGRHSRGELTDSELNREIDLYEQTIEPLMFEYRSKQEKSSLKDLAHRIRESWGTA